MRYSLLKIIPLFLLITFYSINVSSHSGRTNQEGCHVNTSTSIYHCHKKKHDRYIQVNYCIVSNAGTFCGYSSYASCSNAARSANISGFQCLQK